MIKYYLIIYVKNNKEGLPIFMEKAGQAICDCRGSIIEFISFSELKNKEEINNFWSKRKETIKNKNLKLILISHGIHDPDNEPSSNLYKLIINDKDIFDIYIDYSSGDPNYNTFWEEIRNCDNCCKLLERLEYWEKHYRVDEIRRIKHRSINKLIPIITDLERLIELIDNGKSEEIKQHIETINQNWPEKDTVITRLISSIWFILIGKEGLEGLKVGMKMPDPELLPEIKNKERYSLYKWLRETRGADKVKKMTAWVKLLYHCQIYQVCDGVFDKKHKNGIWELATSIEKQFLNIMKNNNISGSCDKYSELKK